MEAIHVVQDAETGEDRLVREDGSVSVFPLNTLLPWCKARGIKLKKLDDDPPEYSVDTKSEFQHNAVIAHGWPDSEDD